MGLPYVENVDGKRRVCWTTFLLFAVVCSLPGLLPYLFFTFMMPAAESARTTSIVMGIFIGFTIFGIVYTNALKTPLDHLPRRNAT